MKQIYLMRHGQTLFNVQKRIQGWCDSPLTELGIEQAQNARRYFQQHAIVFDALYSSPAERCCDTLEIVTESKNYERLKGLKEFNFGVFEGQQEYLHPSPKFFFTHPNHYLTFGGDSFESLKERLYTTVKKIADEEAGQSILIVSHGAASSAFATAVLNSMDGCRLPMPNCAIFEYQYDKGQFRLIQVIDPQTDETYPVNRP